MNVEWLDLAFSICRSRSQEHHVLAPCSGSLSKGRTLCVMGPSGSGKTTFLNCVSGTTEHHGEVRFNGLQLVHEVRQAIAYLEQGDAINSRMSVREHLRFLAELRYGIFSQKAKEKVTEVLDTVYLHHAVDRFCDTLSRAEQKLVCVARAMVADPLLLILDESLSGLEFAHALKVLQAIRGHCTAGKITLILAVQVTSSLILESFDDLVLLRRGETVYNGPVWSVGAVFEKFGLIRCASEGIAEYLLEHLYFETAGDLAWTNLKDVVARQKEKVPVTSGFARCELASFRNRYYASLERQLFLLVRRFLISSGISMFTKTQIMVHLADVVVAGSVFFQLTSEERGLYERFAIVNWILGHWATGAMFRGMFDLSADWDVVAREVQMGCYSLRTYYLARIWLTLPLDLVHVIIWNTLLCWMSRTSPSFTSYIFFQIVVCLSYTCYHSIGLCISAARSRFKNSMTLGLILVTYSLTWSAFYTNLDRIPWYFSWIRHINILQYAVALSMGSLLLPVGDLQGLTFTCEAMSQNTDICTEQDNGIFIMSSEAALQHLNLLYNVPTCLVVLGSTMIVFRVFLLYGLLCRSFPDVARTTMSHLALDESPYAIMGPRSSVTRKNSKDKDDQDFLRYDLSEEQIRCDSKERGSNGCRNPVATYDSEGIELALLRTGALRPFLE